MKSTLQLTNKMPLVQRRLVKTVLTLLGTTLEEEFSRYNTTINIVTTYYRFKKGRPL